MPPPQDKQDAAARFRESLHDVLVVVEKLAPFCQNVEDMVGMVQLALENSGQLTLLFKQVTSK